MISVVPYNDSIELSEIQDCFRRAWSIYPRLYSGGPIGQIFQGYIDHTVTEGDLGVVFRETHLCDPLRRFFVALDEKSHVVGHVAVVCDVKDGTAELIRMAVAPECQGRGVTRLLERSVLRFAAQNECHMVWLTTGDLMLPASALYRALGYEPTKREYIPDYGATAIRYEKIIPEEEIDRRCRWKIQSRVVSPGVVEATVEHRVVGRLKDGWDEDLRVREWKTKQAVKESMKRAWEDDLRKREHARIVHIMGDTVDLGPTWTAEDVRIRRYRKEDLPAVTACFLESWVSNIELWRDLNPIMSRALIRYVHRALEEDMEDPAKHFKRFWVAEGPGGRILGHVALYETGELKRMAVHPAARRMGVAVKLTSTLEEWCRQHNYEKVFLTTGSFMPDAVRMYLRLGYTYLGMIFVNIPGSESPLPTCIKKFEKYL